MPNIFLFLSRKDIERFHFNMQNFDHTPHLYSYFSTPVLFWSMSVSAVFAMIQPRGRGEVYFVSSYVDMKKALNVSTVTYVFIWHGL